ncbi:hypothetical protein BJ875DRAFT_542223 [Amylocarpus encephaloides]|uniref:Uncharacterized protein n=1 Tax=Amylocarpus encephaloides TaxID=45428 RepID=A0A9P7YKA1_9HELO|nr:hypothetical protein BJ875DRAFT_542223 [Amylocarpus encephaloides]
MSMAEGLITWSIYFILAVPVFLCWFNTWPLLYPFLLRFRTGIWPSVPDVWFNRRRGEMVELRPGKTRRESLTQYYGLRGVTTGESPLRLDNSYDGGGALLTISAWNRNMFEL